MITIKELAKFLHLKQEHYPQSDKFMVEYRQKNGGYIWTARITGHPTYQTMLEPNQKWHFFENWLIMSLVKNNFTLDDNASKFYRVSCPELLLWFFEAVFGTEDPRIQKAVEIAVNGKNGWREDSKGKEVRLQPRDYAPAMKALFPWTEIENIVREELENR